jgi:hypothetical protein
LIHNKYGQKILQRPSEPTRNCSCLIKLPLRCSRGIFGSLFGCFGFLKDTLQDVRSYSYKGMESKVQTGRGVLAWGLPQVIDVKDGSALAGGKTNALGTLALQGVSRAQPCWMNHGCRGFHLPKALSDMQRASVMSYRMAVGENCSKTRTLLAPPVLGGKSLFELAG